MATRGAMRAGVNISSRFRKALPHLPVSNSQTLAEIISAETCDDTMLELLQNVALNTKLIPDPDMEGATDCYKVPCDDVDAIRDFLKKVRL